MNYKKNLILSTLLLSSVATYSMEQDKINNNLSMGNFDKLPKEIQKEIFKYIFEDKYLDSLSLDDLKKVFNLKCLSKKIRIFIKDDFKKEIRSKEDKLGLELINQIDNYKPISGLWSFVGFIDKPLELIKKLIEVGANLNACEYNLGTSLTVACKNFHENIIDLLLSSGANIDEKRKGYTLLMSVCYFSPPNSLQLISLLIKKKANINLCNEYGRAALIIACEEGKLGLDIIKLLINSGADVNLKGNEMGETALMIVCKSGRLDLAKLLISLGADVNLKDNKMGHTSLMMARNSQVAKLLINAKADINVKDIRGQTSLMHACYGQDIELVKLLIANGANLNIKNNMDVTSLFYVLSSNNKEVLELLISAKADLSLIDSNLVDICKELGHIDTIELLEDAIKRQSKESKEED